MAYGDQPALIYELVGRACACGFEITAAGKGMNFEPRYRYSTPDTVWGLFGWSAEMVKKDRLNPKLYNASPTARRRPSECPPLRMERASIVPMMDSRSLRAASMTSRECSARQPMARSSRPTP